LLGEAAYATSANSYRIDVTGEFRRPLLPAILYVELRASGLELIRFYGVGNETDGSRPDSVYRVRHTQLLLAPTLAIPLAPRGRRRGERHRRVPGTRLRGRWDDGPWLRRAAVRRAAQCVWERRAASLGRSPAVRRPGHRRSGGRRAGVDPGGVVRPLARGSGGRALARLAAPPGQHPVDRTGQEPGAYGDLRPRRVHVLIIAPPSPRSSAPSARLPGARLFPVDEQEPTRRVELRLARPGQNLKLQLLDLVLGAIPAR